MTYEILLVMYAFIIIFLSGFLYKEVNIEEKSSEYAINVIPYHQIASFNKKKEEFVDIFLSYFDKMSNCQKEIQRYETFKSKFFAEIKKCKKNDLTKLLCELQRKLFNYLVSVFNLTINFKEAFINHVIMCYITDSEPACKIRDEFNNILEFLKPILDENDFSDSSNFIKLYNTSYSLSKYDYILKYLSLLKKLEEKWKSFNLFAKLNDEILPLMISFFYGTKEERTLKENLDDRFGDMKENEYIDDIFLDKMFKTYFGKKK